MQHFRVKIFAETTPEFDLGAAIPVFHRWIQQDALGQLLIDVADYRHVPAGPGIVLVGHDAFHSLDLAGDRLGLLYSRRTAHETGVSGRVRDAWRRAVAACRRLEREPEFAGRIRFLDPDAEISVNDRMLAPNTDGSWSALEPELRRVLESEIGAGKFSLARAGAPRELLAARVSPL